MGTLLLLLGLGTTLVVLSILLGVAPTPSVRGTPSTSGYMDEGFPSFITLSNLTTIPLREIEVTALGREGGEPIKITTMWNTVVHTKSPRILVEDEDVTVKVAYPTQALPLIRAQINKKQTITITHPDGSTDAFYGFPRSFKPEAYKEGEMPVATLVICVTNWDPTNHAEAVPAFAQGSGTGGA